MNRIAIVAVLAASGLALAQDKAPSVPAIQIIQPGGAKPSEAQPQKTPLYDEAADGKKQIEAALAKAKKENQRVLIQWGFNSCHWCQLMHRLYKSDAKLSRELMYEYQVVYVDTGAKGKHMDLAASYGADVKTHGFPYLTVLDSTGKAIANQETESLENKDANGKSVGGDQAGHDPAKMLAFLKANEATPLVASAVLAEGRAAAKAQGKKVFLHFGAPWCGWCHRLEDWMAKPEVAKLLAKDFVDVKVDQDRMTGASDIFAQYNKNHAKSGIPWFVFVDPSSGDAITTSDGTKGNIGFPAQPDEIAHFVTMLKAAAKNLSDSDIKALQASLEEGRKN